MKYLATWLLRTARRWAIWSRSQFGNLKSRMLQTLSNLLSIRFRSLWTRWALYVSTGVESFVPIQPLGIKWVWTDSLAIPGGKRALNFLEEELKGKLINAMANIYREARMVLVFDALCLQLNSTNPVQVAIILSLGSACASTRLAYTC
jgi:hypothetical protein